MAKSLELILDDLGSEDEFNIITFGQGDPQTFRPDMQDVSPTNIAAAKTWLDGQVKTLVVLL